MSPVTRTGTLSAIKAFFAYLVEEELVSADPAHDVHHPRAKSVRTDVYAEAEAEEILRWWADLSELR